MFKEIKKCRLCGNKNLVKILDLGSQYLTGIFPKKINIKLKKYPLVLVKCHGGKESCHLVQLKHNQDYKKMFSLNYGYKSSLNKSMVDHLQSKVKRIVDNDKLNKNDIVVDIGSNDGTTLSFFSSRLIRIGFDPIGEKFKENYKDKILVKEFFSSKSYFNRLEKKAKIILSLSMFYDVEDPISFCKQIEEIIDAEHGKWILEQSYLPTMVQKNSYDTICHEHLTYYSLSQINWILKKTNLKIIDFELNNINGGSSSITVVHKNNTSYKSNKRIEKIIKNEEKFKKLKIFRDFESNVKKTKKDLVNLLDKLSQRGQFVQGIGASTKGNVILQYCEIDTKLLKGIGEVNCEKYNHFTPGSWIKITDQKKMLKEKNSYLLMLPWHFKSFFLKQKVFKGKKLIFPLPKVKIVNN